MNGYLKEAVKRAWDNGDGQKSVVDATKEFKRNSMLSVFSMPFETLSVREQEEIINFVDAAQAAIAESYVQVYEYGRYCKFMDKAIEGYKDRCMLPEDLPSFRNMNERQRKKIEEYILIMKGLEGELVDGYPIRNPPACLKDETI